MGGRRLECDQCGDTQLVYNSCGNRHCPKCQGARRADWTDQQIGELLPVPYFHVVFTMPQPVAQLALQNKQAMYGLLFRAASETLLTVAADQRHLGARIGVLAVLHTWGQRLAFHPHLHCIVTAGGLSPDGESWTPPRGSQRKPFLAPVKILSAVFRGKFLSLLRDAVASGDVHFRGRLSDLKEPNRFDEYVNAAAREAWVVYVKRPFASPTVVLKYLARYTHRVAISNGRLVGISADRVAFRWKDYTDANKIKVAELDGCEFLRRFLMHVLPRGFVRIRRYGLLANRCKAAMLQHGRKLLGSADGCKPSGETSAGSGGGKDKDCTTCPTCQQGALVLADQWDRLPVMHRIDWLDAL